ncbi:hypothetical protein M5X04_14635 [Paenibacillus alvei]|uniref:Phage ABA sandwich domain-containing protein n=1 Tax=Paenibacillus alvei TaxID=44250 RepID=A0ABT4EDY1_PAEAL|nr:hypothetical protein [Paenibacillus alvei]MCY9530556.1 hypothetical protein [Paenibacillus alvei]
MKIIEFLNQANKVKTYTREQILSMPIGTELDELAISMTFGKSPWNSCMPSLRHMDSIVIQEIAINQGEEYIWHLASITGAEMETGFVKWGETLLLATPEQRTKAAILALLEQSGGTGE